MEGPPVSAWHAGAGRRISASGATIGKSDPEMRQR